MLFDVVHEVRALVEMLVSSLVKLVEGGVEAVKQGLNSLCEDVDEGQGKLEQHALDSILESARMRCANTLKEWTGKTSASIVYDSTVDEFTDECLFQAVKGKPNIAIIATTTDGDVFGGFYSVAVTQQDEAFKDPNIFAFSFESHGRCETPQRFVVKKEMKDHAFVKLVKVSSSGFVWFDGGNGWFFLGNEKSRPFCVYLSNVFEGIEDTTLTGKGNYEDFTCCRLVAVQLE